MKGKDCEEDRTKDIRPTLPAPKISADEEQWMPTDGFRIDGAVK